MNNIQRGALIVFEGLDRSGKSTQSRLLVESLKSVGRSAERIAFPDRSTPIGKIISEYLSNKDYDLNDKALHLLFTANRFENVKKIKKLIFNGVNVIVDRYSYSGIVFSVVKKGMDIDWCKAPESGLPAPDVVFFLNLPFEDIQKRPGFGDERYENINLQSKVLKEYKKLASEHNFTIVNANETKEHLQSVLLEKSTEIISRIKNMDLNYLNFLEQKDTRLKEKENIDVSNLY